MHKFVIVNEFAEAKRFESRSKALKLQVASDSKVQRLQTYRHADVERLKGSKSSERLERFRKFERFERLETFEKFEKFEMIYSDIRSFRICSGSNQSLRHQPVDQLTGRNFWAPLISVNQIVC